MHADKIYSDYLTQSDIEEIIFGSNDKSKELTFLAKDVNFCKYAMRIATKLKRPCRLVFSNFEVLKDTFNYWFKNDVVTVVVEPFNTWIREYLNTTILDKDSKKADSELKNQFFDYLDRIDFLTTIVTLVTEKGGGKSEQRCNYNKGT